MKAIPIDPSRLLAIQAVSARERATHAAASERLNEAMSVSSGIDRELLALNRHVAGDRRREREAKDKVEALRTRKRQAEIAVMDAAAKLEDAKDRLSAANRLRGACEAYANQHAGFEGAHHGR